MSVEPGELNLEAIREAAVSGDAARAAELVAKSRLEPTELRAVFGGMSTETAAGVLAQISDAAASETLLLLPPEQASAMLAELAPSRAAGLLASLPSDERADLLAVIESPKREAIASELPAPMRSESARLLQYPPDTAGGLMETEMLAHSASSTVRDVIRDLRANQQRYAALGVQYLYIVDEARRLVGVAPTRDLLLAPEDARLDSMARGEPVFVRDTASTQELADLFDTHSFLGVPVVEASGVLLGTVNRGDVTDSEQHQTEEQYRRSQGIVGGEELRSMPVMLRLRRRAAWLGVNLVLSLGGAGIIALRQGALAKALIAAAVLPVISATSGNAAMQAAAVSIRELTLGVLDPGAWRRVLWHEVILASMLALPLGLAIAVLARSWGAPGAIGVAVGTAMAANTLVAVGIGAICPLVLRRRRIDPALASGPISTTIADITGFGLTLTLVSLVEA
ncbi:MAG TPA: magnesium transporter [Phycisphaerales bacterium]|nr:magnesium transporter [Phycisphaerales bacterium]